MSINFFCQTVELSEETGSLESEQSTPAKQRGRGKGRGKKKQTPSVTDEEAVVCIITSQQTRDT